MKRKEFECEVTIDLKDVVIKQRKISQDALKKCKSGKITPADAELQVNIFNYLVLLLEIAKNSDMVYENKTAN